MKATHWLTASFTALAIAGGAIAQTFNLAGSNWGTGGTFTGTASAGVLLTSDTTPSGIYFGTAQPDANTFVFGLVNTSSPTGATANYNLSASIAAGTSLTLTFTDINAVPDYIAYTGGPLAAYSYNSTAKTLTLTTNTVNPVASASDPTSATLLSAFGLMIVTGSSHNFSGTVFQTGMFWEDVSPLANYSGANFVAGVNASGINGQTASFYAYMPVPFLQANGIYQPDDTRAVVQKSTGAPITLSNLTIDVYASENPTFLNQTTPWNYRGTSGFDFNGGGNDDFVVATYTNSSWSDANMGITAVPEPSTYALLLGSLALLCAMRRRAANNVPCAKIAAS